MNSKRKRAEWEMIVHAEEIMKWNIFNVAASRLNAPRFLERKVSEKGWGKEAAAAQVD